MSVRRGCFVVPTPMISIAAVDTWLHRSPSVQDNKVSVFAFQMARGFISGVKVREIPRHMAAH